MKPILIVWIAFMLLAPAAAAADQKDDLAREILALTHVNQMMEQLKTQVLQLQDQILSEMDIPEDKKEAAETFKRKIHEKIFEIMSPEQMRDEYIELYTSVYTLEELEGLVRFYKSAAGKSMIEKQPLVLKRSMEISQNKVRLLIPELQKITEEFEASLDEASHKH
jgi:uncharacterized protein